LFCIGYCMLGQKSTSGFPPIKIGNTGRANGCRPVRVQYVRCIIGPDISVCRTAILVDLLHIGGTIRFGEWRSD
jgi:hypothetical protein